MTYTIHKEAFDLCDKIIEREESPEAFYEKYKKEIRKDYCENPNMRCDWCPFENDCIERKENK